MRHVELADGQTQPLRVVLDRTGSLPDSLLLFTDTYAAQTLAVTQPGTEPSYADALRQLGGAVLAVDRAGDHLDLEALPRPPRSGDGLARRCNPHWWKRGPGLATALLTQDLVDRVAWFVAPKLIGKGTASVGNLEIPLMTDALEFAASTWETMGQDALLYGWRRTV